MTSEWVIELSKLFGSDIAVGFYITATVVLVPMAIYFMKRGNWKEKAAGGVIIGFYALLTLVILGLLGQQFFGNGINVLIALTILLALLIYLDPDQTIVKPLTIDPQEPLVIDKRPPKSSDEQSQSKRPQESCTPRSLPSVDIS